MLRLLTALVSGLIFGAGLGLAGMLNPAKVAGFLDLFGNWDPSLAFVMGGGILVNAAGHQLVRRRPSPLFADSFQLPLSQAIDRPLLIGSGIFGIGWGLAGLCPGPVVASLLLNPAGMIPFILLLLAGLWVGQKIAPRLA
jgi:uncharacterized membrane protein YedE/YeeE